MGAAHDFLSKFLPIINYISGLGVAGMGAWYLLFSYHIFLFDWFGPASLIVLAFIMVSSDLKFHGVRKQFKLLDYYLGRGLFYNYIALFLVLLMWQYTYVNSFTCFPDGCSFLYGLYIDVGYIGAYVMISVGTFCIVLHFTSSNKRISTPTKEEADEENQSNNTSSGGANNSDYVSPNPNPSPNVQSTDL